MTKGSLTDGASNSLISSRESSKNADYYHRSSSKMSPRESLKLPPIKNGKNSGSKVYNMGKLNKSEKDSHHFENNLQTNAQNKMT
jgi:hypothetical protein